MINKSSHKSNLWGKKCIGYEFDTLEELRQLKKQHPAVTAYSFSDGCFSVLRSLESIRIELGKKSLQTTDGKVLKGKALVEHYFADGSIKELATPYVFKCSGLRGYSNTYHIEWLTEKEWITAETRKNLWTEVTETVEKESDKYAENTVKPVKLISLHIQKMTKEYDFHTINWYGGSISTVNYDKDKLSKNIFLKNLFYGKTGG